MDWSRQGRVGVDEKIVGLGLDGERMDGKSRCMDCEQHACMEWIDNGFGAGWNGSRMGFSGLKMIRNGLKWIGNGCERAGTDLE